MAPPTPREPTDEFRETPPVVEEVMVVEEPIVPGEWEAIDQDDEVEGAEALAAGVMPPDLVIDAGEHHQDLGAQVDQPEMGAEVDHPEEGAEDNQLEEEEEQVEEQEMLADSDNEEYSHYDFREQVVGEYYITSVSDMNYVLRNPTLFSWCYDYVVQSLEVRDATHILSMIREYREQRIAVLNIINLNRLEQLCGLTYLLSEVRVLLQNLKEMCQRQELQRQVVDLLQGFVTTLIAQANLQPPDVSHSTEALSDAINAFVAAVPPGPPPQHMEAAVAGEDAGLIDNMFNAQAGAGQPPQVNYALLVDSLNCLNDRVEALMDMWVNYPDASMLVGAAGIGVENEVEGGEDLIEDVMPPEVGANNNQPEVEAAAEQMEGGEDELIDPKVWVNAADIVSAHVIGAEDEVEGGEDLAEDVMLPEVGANNNQPEVDAAAYLLDDDDEEEEERRKKRRVLPVSDDEQYSHYDVLEEEFGEYYISSISDIDYVLRNPVLFLCRFDYVVQSLEMSEAPEILSKIREFREQRAPVLNIVNLNRLEQLCGLIHLLYKVSVLLQNLKEMCQRQKLERQVVDSLQGFVTTLILQATLQPPDVSHSTEALSDAISAFVAAVPPGLPPQHLEAAVAEEDAELVDDMLNAQAGAPQQPLPGLPPQHMDTAVSAADAGLVDGMFDEQAAADQPAQVDYTLLVNHLNDLNDRVETLMGLWVKYEQD